MTPPRWRVVVVDDEPPARRTLQLLLAKYPDVAVVAECDHAVSAVEAIGRFAPDLLFIDVQMPGATGIDVIHQAGLDAVPVVIFTTAYAEYALPAFEAHALDYLLKPFSDDRFAAVMTRALRALGQSSRAEVEREPRTLTIRDAGKTLVIPFAEIEWIEAEDYYVRIHAGGRRPLVRRTLQSMADTLDGSRFARVHRSAIVNLDRVREVQPVASGDQQIVLTSGATVRLSRNFREAFNAQLTARAGR